VRFKRFLFLKRGQRIARAGVHHEPEALLALGHSLDLWIYFLAKESESPSMASASAG
jgi:hypothetical protein